MKHITTPVLLFRGLSIDHEDPQQVQNPLFQWHLLVAFLIHRQIAQTLPWIPNQRVFSQDVECLHACPPIMDPELVGKHGNKLRIPDAHPF